MLITCWQLTSLLGRWFTNCFPLVLHNFISFATDLKHIARTKFTMMIYTFFCLWIQCNDLCFVNHHTRITYTLYIFFLSYRSIHVDAICPRHLPQIPLQTKHHQNPDDVSVVGCIVLMGWSGVFLCL